jgi:hypothetical protein
VLLLVLQFQEEERLKNESNLMTLVSDSISAMVFFIMFARDNDAREALFSTIGRLFEGLSDIAKAVLIILVADTLLGYHSEEGGFAVIGRVLRGTTKSRQQICPHVVSLRQSNRCCPVKAFIRAGLCW